MLAKRLPPTLQSLSPRWGRGNSTAAAAIATFSTTASTAENGSLGGGSGGPSWGQPPQLIPRSAHARSPRHQYGPASAATRRSRGPARSGIPWRGSAQSGPLYPRRLELPKDSIFARARPRRRPARVRTPEQLAQVEEVEKRLVKPPADELKEWMRAVRQGEEEEAKGKEEGEEENGVEEMAADGPGHANEKLPDGQEEGGDSLVGDQGRNKSATRKDPDGVTVLVLNSVSKSLLQSDFYRLARQGEHMDGWAGGIFKVIQGRSPITREPLGQYFLFFESRPAAQQYLEDVQRLHKLSRQVLPDRFRLSPAQFSDPQRPARPSVPGLGETQTPQERAHAYTLVPPTGKLNLYEYSADEVQKELWEHLRTLRQDVFDVLNRDWQRPGPEDAWVAGNGGRAFVRRDGTRGDEVGMLVEDDDGRDDPVAELLAHTRRHRNKAEHEKVLLAMEGASMTVGAVREAIDADGELRNLQWQLDLTKGRFAVRPVWLTRMQKFGRDDEDEVVAGLEKMAEEEEEKSKKEEEGNKVKDKDGLCIQRREMHGGYTHFIVTFSDAVEARRFARCWHKRKIMDAIGQRSVVVNATAFW